MFNIFKLDRRASSCVAVEADTHTKQLIRQYSVATPHISPKRPFRLPRTSTFALVRVFLDRYWKQTVSFFDAFQNYSKNDLDGDNSFPARDRRCEKCHEFFRATWSGNALAIFIFVCFFRVILYSIRRKLWMQNSLPLRYERVDILC